MKTCPQCSITFPDSAYYCSRDGNRLLDEPRIRSATLTPVRASSSGASLECHVCGAASPAGEQTCRFCGAVLKNAAHQASADTSENLAHRRWLAATVYSACGILVLALGGWLALHHSVGEGGPSTATAPAAVANVPASSAADTTDTHLPGVSDSDAAALAHLDPAANARLASTIQADLARLGPPPQLFEKPGAALATIQPSPAAAALASLTGPEVAATKPVPRSIGPEVTQKLRPQSPGNTRHLRATRRTFRPPTQLAGIRPPFFPHLRPKLPEASLAQRVEKRLRLDRRFRGVRAEARGSLIVLSGTVFDEGAKHKAVATARTVDGVGKVIDRITTSTAAWLEIERRIEQALRNAGLSKVRISVIGADAYLRGQVASDDEKRRAVSITQAESVTVRTNLIRVVPENLFGF